ncbi:hypothetical protein M569_04339 [Genlisea aurea]|uniref:PUM-HD domain-containing protein n=1 Tax=Genlisea aurea TaxID=192259 RepID=S8E3Z6_9LAMI|nr:hypothetical protein M569_04339 [Genlisea aurea]
MCRKDSKKGSGFQGNAVAQTQAGDAFGATEKARKLSKGNISRASYIRKAVDPETAKYFSEISIAIDGREMDLEERSVLSGNALEEARGKEVELATDYIISHTMQTLLEGCSVEALCSFLKSSAKTFPHISMDKSGSHVAETALKSLATHLENDENYSLIKETLSALCQEISVSPMDIMCNSYGSHVVRRLLCLCKGVSVDSTEFHSKNLPVVQAQRFNLQSSEADAQALQLKQLFPEHLKLLISEMLSPTKSDIEMLLINQQSSLTVLKLLVGQDEELLHVLRVLLCGRTENYTVRVGPSKKLLRFVKENAYSRLMEVILAVAPDNLYDEILMEVFKGSLFRMSSDPFANFVVQALISQSRSQEHIKLIFEELGSKFYDLLELGKGGVVAAVVSSCQRLQFHEQMCCQALTDSFSSRNESPSCIVPRILLLDHYFSTEDKANWNWPNSVKMNVLGSLILQSVFRFPSEFIEAYIIGLTSLEADRILEVSKDPAGARVIEAFLSSDASAKQKRKLIIKLKGHFGELSVLPSGSFTVEKCFNSSNMSLREAIVSELSLLQAQLSKTKQGPYLLKKLDVEGYARRRDQWRSNQNSKQSAYADFYATFGCSSSSSSRTAENIVAVSTATGIKKRKKDIETQNNITAAAPPFLANNQSSSKSKRRMGGGGGGFINQNGESKKRSREDFIHNLPATSLPETLMTVYRKTPRSVLIRMRIKIVVFPVKGRNWCFAQSVDPSIHGGGGTTVPGVQSSNSISTFKELYGKLVSSFKGSDESRLEVTVDFIANKMNRAWSNLEKAPQGTLKNKIHGIGLKLLSRVKPSETFFRSIPKQVAGMDIVYPSR